MPVIDNKTCYGFEKRYDADGTVWVKVTYNNDGVAKTPMLVIADEFGYRANDLADSTVYCYVGVPDKAYSTGSIGYIQIGGLCEDVIVSNLTTTVGHAAKIHDGAVADVNSDFTGAAAEFGAFASAVTGANAVDIMLVPERILTTT